MSVERIEVQHSGIGHLLSSRRLAVPPYQRPYSWTKEQVTDLFRDLADAINNRAREYFLGTVVITRSRFQGAVLIGRAAIGRTTVRVLQINCEEALTLRESLIDEGLF